MLAIAIPAGLLIGLSLVLALGFDMPAAVGISLLVITINRGAHPGCGVYRRRTFGSRRGGGRCAGMGPASGGGVPMVTQPGDSDPPVQAGEEQPCVNR